MKKTVLLLLLTLLSFQFVWAAAASYCQHEPAPEAQHFGHHQHIHGAEAASAEDDGAVTTADADCGYCHLSCQASFLVAPLAFPAPSLSKAGIFLLASFSSRLPDRLQRPDWRFAA